MKITGASGNQPFKGNNAFADCQNCVNQIKTLDPNKDQTQIMNLMTQAIQDMQNACGPNGGQQGVCADWMIQATQALGQGASACVSFCTQQYFEGMSNPPRP